MALLQIHTFPDPILKQVAKPVEVFDAALRKTAENMLETMYASDGIGLGGWQRVPSLPFPDPVVRRAGSVGGLGGRPE